MEDDQVGAIVGQMAGALYGWQQILADEWSNRCVACLHYNLDFGQFFLPLFALRMASNCLETKARNLMYWDKGAEIGLRAAAWI